MVLDISYLIAKIPSFCLLLALLAIALPQTPSQFFIYICMVGVLGTLLHCVFYYYYCICMVLRGETD